MTKLDVPVLIVGGGGAGLTASMLLSKLGVESLLVSALPTTSILPKAHVLNQRCMEIFTDLGVAQEIYARGTPAENMRYSAYYAGLAGPDPVYGRQLGRLECWGAGGLDLDWASASPCRQANLPQIRLEPILKRRAEALAPGRVRFHHELVAFEQDGDGVTATVRDKDAEADLLIRSRYLLACDGGRTVGPKLGVKLEGPRDMFQIVSVYMTADLSGVARDPDAELREPGHPSARRRPRDRGHEASSRAPGPLSQGARGEPVVDGGHPGGPFPSRAGVPGGRCGAPPTTHGRARPHRRRPAATATPRPRWSTTAHPRRRRSTRSASTSRAPARERRCRTSSSTTGTAGAFRSWIS